MNNCLYCGKLVRNKFCNVSCQNKYQGSEKNNIRFGKLIEFNVVCKACGTSFMVIEREKLHPQKNIYYCSRGCANKRVHTLETKNKLSLRFKHVGVFNCKFCGNSFEQKKITQIFCNKSCSTKFRMPLKGYESIAGQCSVKSQNKRSKNEAYFADLCKTEFSDVICNEQMFNGWDADVIIEEYKIAVLWNGIWHYKKIAKKHSLIQVVNRDLIKTKEIINCGYEPYVIKDLGKFNKSFVENEFLKLKAYIARE